jgi:cytoskeleton protein RodZ
MVVVDLDSSKTGTARVGAELREVRERLGWSLPDVAARLRIRLPFLHAIEAGDLAALPGPAYVTGFIRAYAETLGLDPDEILRRFRAEGMPGERKPALVFPAAVPDRAVPTGAILLLSAILLIGGYFLWYRHSEATLKLAQTIQPVPQKLAPLALPKPVAKPQAPTPAPQPATEPATQTAAETPAQSPTPAPTPAPASAPTAPPTSTATAASAGTQPNVAASNAAPPATQTSAAAEPASPGAPPMALPAQGQAIVATADSWVQVRDATGAILFSRVLPAGQSWPVPAEPGLTLTTGNAGGTALANDGKIGAALGPTGAVLRHFQLTEPAPGAVQSPVAPASTASPSAPK